MPEALLALAGAAFAIVAALPTPPRVGPASAAVGVGGDGYIDRMHLAQVFAVMIASPSDVPEARQAVYDSLAEWNDASARTRKVILLPLKWETSAVPRLGGDAQEIINHQLVDDADIVIALFGSRLGRETSRALSGTAEEMNRAHAAGKPVHPFFSDEPLPRDVDVDELKRLRDFQEELAGLYSTFANTGELRSKVWQAIEHDIAQLQHSVDAPPGTNNGVDFLVQPASERLPKTDSRGRLKYETKRWVDLTNRGDVDAEDVVVEAAPDTSFWLHWSGPTTIQHGQTRKVPVTYSAATSRAAIVVSWTEAGEERSRQFDID
ncbi:hypothetical protein SAMN06296429_106118 [Janibacter indicus]|uniref:DUF4062 domain-containing protein n=2 Tax=Janibacter indicus TaxID=857417 RepID=A0A1W2APU8_9MICO|nr:hypothetical protein SAMN06296429_106118 [Janibacter indicus]